MAVGYYQLWLRFFYLETFSIKNLSSQLTFPGKPGGTFFDKTFSSSFHRGLICEVAKGSRVKFKNLLGKSVKISLPCSIFSFNSSQLQSLNPSEIELRKINSTQKSSPPGKPTNLCAAATNLFAAAARQAQ